MVGEGDNPPAHIMLIKTKDSGSPDKEAGPASETDNEGDHMSAAIKKALGLKDDATDAEVEAAVAKSVAAAASVATLTEETNVLKSIAAMSPDSKGRYDDLMKTDTTKAKVWADTPEAERASILKAEAAGDESYQMTDGTTITKRNLGEAQFNIFKSLDATNKTLVIDATKARDEALTASLRLDVQKKYPSVTGTEDEKVAMLKGINAMTDPVAKAQALKALEVAENLTKANMITKGHGGSGIDDAVDSPNDKVEKRCQEIAKAENISIAKARVKFSDTPEYQDLMRAQN